MRILSDDAGVEFDNLETEIKRYVVATDSIACLFFMNSKSCSVL